ncbi:hypothetical protein [Planctomycetes bacterium K23_9]|uniref:Uncharacterized protein n=1 Tax=Stieleria marina TaxID=1930275 RepID=A0A517NYE0_9BACT|nr:hypothetical protein K239x_41550 [Planctomycetes bacterium K23_9]
MAKFYVQCGPVQIVLQADTVEKAALAAIDHALQSHIWIYDDQDLTESDCQDHLMLEALLHLEPSIRVSEQGFDRKDALHTGTPEMIQHWHQLMVGMRRLFVIAGLESRTMADVASDQAPTPAVGPQLPR